MTSYQCGRDSDGCSRNVEGRLSGVEQWESGIMDMTHRAEEYNVDRHGRGVYTRQDSRHGGLTVDREEVVLLSHSGWSLIVVSSARVVGMRKHWKGQSKGATRTTDTGILAWH
ncbi:hypothetical protein Tco_1437644 [Tanacetum coccineum]